jgi:hypothetical protein
MRGYWWHTHRTQKWRALTLGRGILFFAKHYKRSFLCLLALQYSAKIGSLQKEKISFIEYLGFQPRRFSFSVDSNIMGMSPGPRFQKLIRWRIKAGEKFQTS